MEIIKLEMPFNKEEFLKVCSLRFKLEWKPFVSQIINIAIVTSVFLIISVVLFIEEKQFNPFFVVDAVFGIILLVMLTIIYASKKQYKKDIIELANKYENIKMDCCYEINSESIKYSDKEKNMELKWEVFKYYILYQNYLILTVGDSILAAYFFGLHETDVASFEKILDLASQKLKLKTIK